MEKDYNSTKKSIHPQPNKSLGCGLLGVGDKFQILVDQNKNLKITHKEFKDLIDKNNFKICKLQPNFKRRTVYWKQFEKWLKDPKFNPYNFD